MKKYYFLIIVTLILGLVLTGCSLLSNVGQVPSTTEQSGITYLTKSSYTETDPYKTDLLAGQTNKVGEVKVWNDAEYLYVKYEITGEALTAGWVITETHLAVADSLAGIPQTKTGNPIPGKFEHSMEHDPAVTEYTYTIPITWDPCTDLYIAAHAVVQKLSDVMTVTLASGTQTTLSAGYTETEPEYPLAPANYSGLGTWSAAVPVSSPPIPPWVDPSVVLPGAVWVSSAATTEGGFGDQWRLFKEEFEIPPGAVITSASLTMTADNAVEAYLNGTLVGTTGDVYLEAPIPQPYNFAKLWGPYTLTPLVGLNNLMFVVRNWVHSAYNPTGLTYKLDYEYQLLEEETAWADGERFTEKGNWATYFDYTVVKECCDFNAVGNWEMDMYIGTASYARFIIITSHVDGDINGLFGLGYDITGAPTGIITGTIDGCSINMLYERTDIETDYTADFEGIIAADGNSMSGTWSDYARTDESWTMTRQ